MGQNPPSGWYPDPEVPNQQRYWDGSEWTEHRSPSPSQQSPAHYATIEELKTGSSTTTKVLLIGALVVGVVAFVIAGVVDGAKDDQDAEQPLSATPAPSPTPRVRAEWSTEVRDVEFLNPATVRVFVTVKNVGDAEGIPQCTIRVRDVSYTYSGWTLINLKEPIERNRVANFTTTITVTDEGAAYVTKSQAHCKTRWRH